MSPREDGLAGAGLPGAADRGEFGGGVRDLAPAGGGPEPPAATPVHPTATTGHTEPRGGPTTTAAPGSAAAITLGTTAAAARRHPATTATRPEVTVAGTRLGAGDLSQVTVDGTRPGASRLSEVTVAGTPLGAGGLPEITVDSTPLDAGGLSEVTVDTTRLGAGDLSEVTVDGTEIAPGVWVASAAQADLGDLPAHEADLAEAGTRPRWRRGEFLAGRYLLRRLLRRVRPDLAALPLRADPAGKPRLDPGGGPDLALPGITISHDGDRIAAAVCAHGDVGVDVQLPPEELTDSAVRRCLGEHAPEVTALPRARRAKEFAWVWTVQEACVKAAGTGLAGRPWSIDVPPGAQSGRWRGFTWLSLRSRSRVPLSCAFHPAPHR